MTRRLHSRETLRGINRNPIDSTVLRGLVFGDEYYGNSYLTYQCICRYLNKFAEIYSFPTTCDQDIIFLTKDLILDDNHIWFYEDGEVNNMGLLFGLADYCGWDFMVATYQELSEAGLLSDEFAEKTWEQLVRENEYITDKAKHFLLKMRTLVEELSFGELECIYILSIRRVTQYLRYREAHGDIVQEKFWPEDLIISEIMNHIEDVLAYSTNIESCNDPEEYLIGWTTGGDGYHYDSLAHLDPNWLISMYVLHGLLEHAQMVLGYQTGGS